MLKSLIDIQGLGLPFERNIFVDFWRKASIYLL